MPRQFQLRRSLSSLRRHGASATVTALLLTAALTLTAACGPGEPITPEEFCATAPPKFYAVSDEFDDTVATADSVNSFNVLQTTQALEQNSVRLNNFTFDLLAVSTNIQPPDGDPETYVELAERFHDYAVKMVTASSSMKAQIRKYREEWDIDNFNRFIVSLAEVQDNGLGAYNNMSAICAVAGLPIE